MTNRCKIKVGDQVAFNNLSDATWFNVTEINGSCMRIRENGNTKYAEQYADTSMVVQVRNGPKPAQS